MSDIQYVCLSDMHLGQEESILTKLNDAGTDIDPKEANPILKKLVECLRYLIQENNNNNKPTLILNGDILELALTTYNKAAMVFERFIELVMPEDNQMFEKIVFIPGNHDHHLWETARETQYINYILIIRYIEIKRLFKKDIHNSLITNFIESLKLTIPYLYSISGEENPDMMNFNFRRIEIPLISNANNLIRFILVKKPK